jgi:AAA+ superfamily predicted ATPase
MTDENNGKFEIINVVKIEDLADKTVKEIPESDLCFQTSTHIIQFGYKDEEKEKDKYKITPGVWTFTQTNQGLILQKLELKNHNLLESATNTALIKKEANIFFSKIDVYKKFNKDPRRAILLYSQPGMGKSSTISKLSRELIQEDPGTVIVFWDTSSIKSSSVNKFLSVGSFFDSSCTKMLFVMEDIGGGNVEDYYGPKSADASLLELLDGASVTFRVPTFIIATTNTPESLLKSLADRPGRFDQMFELEAPNATERVSLVSYIAKRELSEEEVASIKDKKADGLSIAHLTEIVVRAELHDKKFSEVIEEMRTHRQRIEKAFAKAQKALGLN